MFGTAVSLCFTLGKLYVIGGKNEYQLGYANVDVVNFSTGNTAAAASMQAPRISACVTSSASFIYVFGGWQGEESLSSCEMYNAHLEM